MNTTKVTAEERAKSLDFQLLTYALAVKKLRDLQEIAKKLPECVNANDLASAQFDVDWLTELHLTPTPN